MILLQKKILDSRMSKKELVTEIQAVLNRWTREAKKKEEKGAPYLLLSSVDRRDVPRTCFISTGARTVETLDLPMATEAAILPRSMGIGAVFNCRAWFPFMLMFPVPGGHVAPCLSKMEAKQTSRGDYVINFPNGLPIGALQHIRIWAMRGIRMLERLTETEPVVKMTVEMWSSEDFELIDGEKQPFHTCWNDNVIRFVDGAMGFIYIPDDM